MLCACITVQTPTFLHNIIRNRLTETDFRRRIYQPRKVRPIVPTAIGEHKITILAIYTIGPPLWQELYHPAHACQKTL